VEAGIVDMTVGLGMCVCVAVGCGAGVSVGNDVFVGEGRGVTVLVLGWQATSATVVSRIILFNFLSIPITSFPIYK
jgi:hypothetical protein